VTATQAPHPSANPTPDPAPAAVSDNAILAISARAAQLRSQGLDVVDLAAGEPDTATARFITEAAAHAALHGDHHYSSAAGDPALRAAVAAQLPTAASPTSEPLTAAPFTADPFTAEDVQITLGTKHALSLALGAVLRPGEDVLLARPGWPGHTGAVLAAAGRPVHVPVSAANGFLPTAADLEAARTPGTRAVVLASPANPSGAVLSGQDWAAIATWATTHDVWVICDDVYAQLVYDTDDVGDVQGPARAVHLLHVAPGARQRCIIVGGVSKAYAMTGWRVGWLAGPPQVIAAARRHISRTITHVPNITQAAALAALTAGATAERATNGSADEVGDVMDATDAVGQAVNGYRRGRDLLVAALDALPGISCPTPAGGMFVFPDVTAAMGRGGWSSTVQMAADLLEQTGVAVVPGEAFDAPGHLRMCFAVSPAALATAVERLVTVLTPQSSGAAAPAQSGSVDGAATGAGVSVAVNVDEGGAP